MSQKEFHMHRKQYDGEVMTAKEDDQFFTHPLIAERCWKTLESAINVNDYDKIIEPSAGDGSFLSLLPKNKRVGVDLVKQHPEVIESDFFKWFPDNYNPLLFERGNNLVVGNPPFGKNSNLAIEFFNHAAAFADVIAFIIPRTWRKWSVQHKLNSEFGLYFDATLPYHSFYVNNQPWHRIRCCFQIWSRTELEFDNQTPDWKEMDLKWNEFKIERKANKVL